MSFSRPVTCPVSFGIKFQGADRGLYAYNSIPPHEGIGTFRNLTPSLFLPRLHIKTLIISLPSSFSSSTSSPRNFKISSYKSSPRALHYLRSDLLKSRHQQCSHSSSASPLPYKSSFDAQLQPRFQPLPPLAATSHPSSSHFVHLSQHTNPHQTIPIRTNQTPLSAAPTSKTSAQTAP
jgi:hypothetical protein